MTGGEFNKEIKRIVIHWATNCHDANEQHVRRLHTVKSIVENLCTVSNHWSPMSKGNCVDTVHRVWLKAKQLGECDSLNKGANCRKAKKRIKEKTTYLSKFKIVWLQWFVDLENVDGLRSGMHTTGGDGRSEVIHNASQEAALFLVHLELLVGRLAFWRDSGARTGRIANCLINRRFQFGDRWNAVMILLNFTGDKDALEERVVCSKFLSNEFSSPKRLADRRLNRR